LGDNARQHALMTADDQTRQAAAGPAEPPRGARGRLRALARTIVPRVAPSYARRRAREAATAVTVARLQSDFEHVRERHDEQIERLEDLVRELVRTAESLRRAGAARGDRTGD
jgi:hypothetical protein